MQMLSGVTRSYELFSASILNSKTVSGSPFSEKPMDAYMELHVSLHCASVALNIRAKKMAVAIRGEERGHVD